MSGRPCPPQSSGRLMPSQPRSAIFFYSAAEYWPGSFSAARTSAGVDSAAKNSRAVSWMSVSCSSGNTSTAFSFLERVFARLRQAEALACDLVAHDLHASVVHGGLEGRQQVVRVQPVLHVVGRAVEQLRVWAEHLPDGLGGAHAVFGRPHLFGRAFVVEGLPALLDGHAAHGHEAAHLALDPELGHLVAHGGVVYQRGRAFVARLQPVDNVLVALDRDQVAPGADAVQVEAALRHRPAIALLSQQAGRRHLHVVEENLVGALFAVGGAGRPAGLVLHGEQGAHGDARRVHRHQQDRQAGVAP